MKRNILTIMAGAVLVVLAAAFVSCGSKGGDTKDGENKDSKVIINKDIITWRNPDSWNTIPQECRFIETAQGSYNLTDKDGKMEIAIDFVKTKDVGDNVIENLRTIDLQLGGCTFQADKSVILKEIQNAKIGDKLKIPFSYIYASDKEKQRIIEDKTPSMTIELCLPKEVSESDSGDDLLDVEGEYDKASKKVADEYDKAYKKVSDEYEKASKKAQDEYDRAYQKAQKQVDDALNSYGW